MADVVYKDANVRFTLIDEGTLRLEYAPDGKFVDNKSFMAVIREYPNVLYTIKDNTKQVTISTSKLKLVYKKRFCTPECREPDHQQHKGYLYPIHMEA